MATPGAIGVYLSNGPVPERVNKRAWRGVYHHWGGQPDDLGAELIASVARAKGDLAAVVRELIDAAPNGWASLAEGRQLEDLTSVGPEDTGNVAYAYVFDLGARRLDAFATHADASGERGGSVFFRADGTCASDGFAFVEPPAPPAPVTIHFQWQPAGPEHAAARAETRLRVERDCANANLPVDTFLELASRAIVEAFTRADWEGKAAPLRSVFMPRAGDFWRVRLGELDVHYPLPDCRRDAVRTDIDGNETLTAFSQDEAYAKLDVRRSAIARRVTGEHQARVGNVLLSAVHPPAWIFSFFDLVRATQIPDEGPKPAAPMTKPPWKVFRHSDGRVWAIRPGGPGYLLRLGEPTDDPVIKERQSKDVPGDIARLIAEQRADGFIAAPDEPYLLAAR